MTNCCFCSQIISRKKAWISFGIPLDDKKYGILENNLKCIKRRKDNVSIEYFNFIITFCKRENVDVLLRTVNDSIV